MQDLTNYNKNAVIIAKKYFNVSDIDDYYKKADAKPLIFCHFARGLGDKVYNEVTEFKDLYKTLMEVSTLLVTSIFWLCSHDIDKHLVCLATMIVSWLCHTSWLQPRQQKSTTSLLMMAVLCRL